MVNEKFKKKVSMAPNMDYRRKRIIRIKKSIRIIMVLSILLPIFLCIVLFSRVNQLNQNVSTLGAKIDEVIKNNASKGQEITTKENGLTSNENEDNADGVDTKLLQTPIDSINNTKMEGAKTIESILPNSTGKIYLTFDDGPSPYTNEILDILAKYDVKATFFVVGREEPEYEAIYKRIIDEGHTLGIHSYSHEYEKIYASAEDFLDDYWKLNDFLYSITGETPFCYRFPGGSSTTKMGEDTDVFIDCIKECGALYFDWNVSSQDASAIPLTKEQVAENVISSLDKYDTTIVLMHDAYGKHTTVEALPEIIEAALNMENTVLLPISIGTEQIHQK